MAINSWTSEGMDWTKPNPMDSRYATAINRAILERLSLIYEKRNKFWEPWATQVWWYPPPEVFTRDVSGNHCSAEWRMEVDRALVAKDRVGYEPWLSFSFCVPIDNADKFTKTMSIDYSEEPIYEYLHLGETGYYNGVATIHKKITAVGSGFMLDRTYEGVWSNCAYLKQPNGTRNLKAENFTINPGPVFYDTRTIFHMLGDTDLIPWTSGDAVGWIKQRKAILDLLIYLPDKHPDFGGRKDTISVAASNGGNSAECADDWERLTWPPTVNGDHWPFTEDEISFRKYVTTYTNNKTEGTIERHSSKRNFNDCSFSTDSKDDITATFAHIRWDEDYCDDHAGPKIAEIWNQCTITAKEESGVVTAPSDPASRTFTPADHATKEYQLLDTDGILYATQTVENTSSSVVPWYTILNLSPEDIKTKATSGGYADASALLQFKP